MFNQHSSANILTTLVHSPGNHTLIKQTYSLGRLRPNNILVKTIYTGLCRSDVQQYLSNGVGGIPLGHFGHESVGQVVRVGTKLRNAFQVGDYVASRSDPAFSTHFFSDAQNAVKIPEPLPKYILEPVACAINIIDNRSGYIGHKVLLIGTGFLANLAAQYLELKYTGVDLTVVGTHNLENFQGLNLRILESIKAGPEKYDTVIDLSGKQETILLAINKLAQNGSLVLAADVPKGLCLTHEITKQLLWNNNICTFPSPRTPFFLACMQRACGLVSTGKLLTEWAWTNEYPWENYEQAFAEAAERKPGTVRSYLKWE